MAGTKTGAAKRKRCPDCHAFAHHGKPCWPSGRGPAPRPLIDRMWSKIDARGPDECWPWTGGCQPGGYGVIDKRTVSRIILGLDDDDPRIGRHTCDNPPCCNPAHLIAGTYDDNSGDMVERERELVVLLLRPQPRRMTEELCAGWVGCHDTVELLALRMNRVDPSVYDYVSPVPLHESGAAAAEAGMADIEDPSPRTMAKAAQLQRLHDAKGIEPI